MRLVATVVFWLVATVALAVAVPSAWAQRNVVDQNGYAALAASAAESPQLQQAMATELTTAVTGLLSEQGYGVNTDLVRGVAAAYTASPSFPGQFATANRIVHRWAFTDAVAQAQSGGWVIDLAPMLADTSFRQTLANFDIEPPQSMTVPVAAEVQSLQPGQFRPLARWGPWVSIGAVVLTGLFALLTLAAARSRGKALAALGVSALLVGAAGWAGIEVLRGRVDDALNRTEGAVRTAADVMVDQAEGSLHHWLNLTLAAGWVLVLVGVVASVLGGWQRTRSTPSRA